MVNEGAKILEERMAIRASDIDVVWVNGYGWPVYRGGPMFYADQVGLKAILDREGVAEDTERGLEAGTAAGRLAAEGKTSREPERCACW